MSKPGSESAAAARAPAPGFELAAFFWLSTAWPEVQTSTAAAAKAHRAATHRNLRDFMAVGSSQNFFRDCSGGILWDGQMITAAGRFGKSSQRKLKLMRPCCRGLTD